MTAQRQEFDFAQGLGEMLQPAPCAIGLAEATMPDGKSMTILLVKSATGQQGFFINDQQIGHLKQMLEEAQQRSRSSLILPPSGIAVPVPDMPKDL